MDYNIWEDTFLASLSGQSSADNRDEKPAVTMDEQDESEDDREETQVLPVSVIYLEVLLYLLTQTNKQLIQQLPYHPE